MTVCEETREERKRRHVVVVRRGAEGSTTILELFFVLSLQYFVTQPAVRLRLGGRGCPRVVNPGRQFSKRYGQSGDVRIDMRSLGDEVGFCRTPLYHSRIRDGSSRSSGFWVKSMQCDALQRGRRKWGIFASLGGCTSVLTAAEKPIDLLGL